MAARPVPTIEQIGRALDRASAGQARQLLKLLRTMPEAGLLAGFLVHGVHLRPVLNFAAGRMDMRAKLRAARKAGALTQRAADMELYAEFHAARKAARP